MWGECLRESERARERETHEEQGTPSFPFHPSLHPSLPPLTHSSSVPKSERGERSSRMSLRIRATKTWLGLWCLSVNSWSSFGALAAFCHRKTVGTKAPAGAAWDLTTAEMPTAGGTHTKHNMYYNCASWEPECAHTFLCVHHILPQCTFHWAHKAAWALKLPLSIFFCEHTHTLTHLPHSQSRSNVSSGSEGVGVFF